VKKQLIQEAVKRKTAFGFGCVFDGILLFSSISQCIQQADGALNLASSHRKKERKILKKLNTSLVS